MTDPVGDSASPKDERSACVDRLRVLAISLVLLHHFDIAYKLPNAFDWSPATASFVHAVARNGNYGVTIFFVISGFLITSNALRRWPTIDRIAPLTFYALRAARLAPGLMLLVLTVAILELLGVPIFRSHLPGSLEPVSPPLVYGAALSFTMNLLIERLGWVNYPLGVLWSLSIEGVFYLTFPLICRLLRRPGAMSAFLAIVVLVGPAYRAMHQGSEGSYLYAYLSALDGIAVGCLAALARSGSRGPGAVSGWLQALTAAAMAILYLSAPIADSNVMGVTLMAVGTAVLLPAGLDRRHRRASRASTRPEAGGAAWLGRHSYELYLFHLVVLGFMRTAVPPTAVAREAILPLLLLFLFLSAFAAGAIMRFYAGPLDRMIRQRSAESLPDGVASTRSS